MLINFKSIYLKSQNGQSLVELLIVIGLCAVLLPVIITGLVSSRGGKAQQKERAEAITLIKEAEEVIRSIREKDWTSLSPIDSELHVVREGTGWALADTAETINGFTRKIVINNVYRDFVTGSIIPTGTAAQVDPSTKKITISVSWDKPVPASVDSTVYLTRYVNNATFLETTVNDFNAGISNSTQITNTSGGEEVLTNNNKAKWCSPSLSSATIDLPDGPPVAVAAMANQTSADIPNDVFVAVAPTASTPVKLAYLNVTANGNTPVPTLKGTFTLDPSKYSNSSLVPTGIGLTNTFKTNDVKYYKSTSNKTYALLATDLPDREVIAILIKDANGNDVFQDPTNKIYKYQTFFNTKIYGSMVSNPTTFNNPTSNSAETHNAGDNNGFQTSPTNAYANDGTFAVDTSSGSGSGTSCTGNDKDKHQFYNYGFSIPTGTTVTGIEVNLVAKVNNTGGSPKMCVQLSWDGGSTWTSAKSTANLTTNSVIYALGGETDTWGRSWSNSNFSDHDFRVRVINVSSSTSRNFSLDYVGVKVNYDGSSSSSNDQAPFGYGGVSLGVLGNKGYVASGGYLYAFDLSNIDTKTASNGLDMMGCRVELDGYDCKPGTGTDRKYSSGQTGTTWSDTTSPVNSDCSDGGNVELYADNDIYPVQVGSSTYVFVAVGAGTNPELDIANVTDVPTSSSSPTISSNSCGRISGGNSAWKRAGSLDFNATSGTEEAANSVYVNSAGTRAYISSNGGIDANHDGKPDSYQLYVINTESKTSPRFLSGTAAPPTSGYYYGSTAANAQLFPRRSMTVLNGQRAILVGKDSVADSKNAEEYQVLNIENETTPTYCGGVNFDAGFNDLTSVTEADGDNFVYMVANTMEKQLKIIQGGADTGMYVSTGTFTSQAHQFNSPTVFNRFVASVDQPVVGSTVELQIAAAPVNPITNDCSGATYVFIGPDAANPTTSKFKSSNIGLTKIEDIIPLGIPVSGYQNPGRCIKYKAFLSTVDNTKTPSLLDMIIKYSP
jgi:type II secretory pathway pseudopilin PulG